MAHRMIQLVRHVLPEPWPEAQAIRTALCNGSPSLMACSTSRCHFAGALPFSSGSFSQSNMVSTKRSGSPRQAASSSTMSSIVSVIASMVDLSGFTPILLDQPWPSTRHLISWYGRCIPASIPLLIVALHFAGPS